VNAASGKSGPYPVVVGSVKYQDIRDQIKTGDILLFSGRRWLSRVIEGISRSKYSHVAFLTRWEGRIIAMQADLRGVEVIPASMLVCRYEGNVEWWRLADAHRHAFDGRDFLDRALSLIGIKYGYLSLLWLGIRIMLGLSVYRKFSHLRPSTLYCSQFVSYCYKNEGMDINAKAGVDGTSPSDFALSGLFTTPHQLYDGSDHKACEDVLSAARAAKKARAKGGGAPSSFWDGRARRDSRAAAKPAAR
jgi:hypothetical protein